MRNKALYLLSGLGILVIAGALWFYFREPAVSRSPFALYISLVGMVLAIVPALVAILSPVKISARREGHFPYFAALLTVPSGS